jgi:uncharacterized protein YigE (DUF2233 family)
MPGMRSRFILKIGQHHFSPARRVCLMVLAALLIGCASDPLTLSAPTPTPAPTPQLVPTLFPTILSHAAATTESSSPPDTGWLHDSSGIELRRLQLSASADHAAASLTIVRMDPAAVRLRVGYAPGQPRPLDAWVRERSSLLVVNGGFFTPEYRATALVVSDGEAYGTSYDGFGGMLAVAPDGSVSLRSLRAQPYTTDESFQQAIQSFPMLVQPGGVPASIDEDGDRTRRTLVAQDKDGRLLFVVCSTFSFSLHELAAWLASSDLQIDRALNLDGGRSTAMSLHAGALQERIDPFDVLPMVLFVEPRS